jgi:glycosyltransferase involved in cell wall biosynthesis
VLTVVSRALAKEVRKLGGEPDRIRVVPMGVDLQQRFVPGCPRPRGRTLIFAGRLVEKKGVSVLLEAMAQLQAEAPDCRLLIAGTGPLRPALETRAADLGIADRVEFLGSYRNHDLPALLRRGDIAVYPFLRAAGGDQEGLGLVMVEAMGCGLPVVAGDLPAVHDVIEDQHTGLLVTPGDPAALGRTLLRLLDDAELAERLSQAGRAYALERFDWQVIADRYADLLNRPAVPR